MLTRRTKPLLCGALLLATVMALSSSIARAATTSQIVGTVRDADGRPVSGATVVLQGPPNLRTSSDAKGAFHFDVVPAGEYTVVVSKGGFAQYQTIVDAFIGETATVSVVLVSQSFSSLRTIARVSTTAPGYAQINTSAAAIDTISNEVFADQGQVQVTKVLNETPGVIAWGSPENNNGADQGSPQTVQIRGALPYETESLIDGHPAPISLNGSFNPIYLSPGLLQNVEVVKGPGYMGPEINYAIGGTANYITLQPTRTPQENIVLGTDNYGGFSTTFTATGSTPSHVVDYAFGYSTNGAPGPLQNYQVAGSQLYLIAGDPFSWKVNGRYYAGVPEVAAPAPPGRYYKYVGTVGQLQFAEPFYVCCWGLNTAYDSKAELGKLRFNFSPSSSLTLSYLGGQAFADLGGIGATSLGPVGNSGSFSVFQPPAGYHGSVPSGNEIPFDLSAFQPEDQSTQQNLYQAEFRTSFGRWTALARYFDMADLDSVYLNTPENAPFVFGGKTWGGAPLCPTGTTITITSSSAFGCKTSGGATVAPVMTYFNGQNATFSTFNATNQSLENDHLRGGSVLLETTSENGGDFTISLDRSHHDSYAFSNIPTTGLPPQYPLPRGASQLFTTETLRDRFFVAKHVFASLSDYFIQYSSHFTDDGGSTWQDATRGYNAPRFAVTWQPDQNISWRLSAGASVAPPYLGLLSSPGSAPQENINGVPSAGYTQDLNNGAIAPETAFGYDLGVDKRIERSMSVSIDLYQENLYNMFLPSTFLVTNDYVPPGGTTGYPLYGSKVANLGHARYEGIEFGIAQAPAAGWGFKFQGSLQRAYTYNLPPGFYCTNVPANQCTPLNYSTNLGIIPNVNFQSSGLGWNTVNSVSVPYSMGYTELNYRTRWGTYWNAGITYYGPNNAYSRPAFFVESAAIREPIRQGTAIQISADNIFGSYNQRWTNYFGGIAAPLQPQCVGKYGTPYQGAAGTVCTSLVPAKDRVIIPQSGPTVGGNYGPTTLRFQVIQQLGPNP
ncbi:MAG TPA: TonB-dependent receptor [Candidatus Baltobacteraceae bacterium]|nr:TonB-dependent receptor [Candidatus Baltobacteraceae bacterium]